MHRQIVGSATYRQISRANSADIAWTRHLQADLDNMYYSRSRRRRVDGESLRDAMLLASGLLNDERGGPGVMPPLSEELVKALLKGQWTTSSRAADHDRRSIYVFARRNLRYPLFDIFDRPNADGSCAARNRSTTPTQSLHLLNSEFSLRIAQHLAGQILREGTDPAKHVDQLYRRAFARHPTMAESQRLAEFIAAESLRIEQEQRASTDLALPIGLEAIDHPHTAAAWVQACLAVLNASEMIYVD